MVITTFELIASNTSLKIVKTICVYVCMRECMYVCIYLGEYECIYIYMYGGWFKVQMNGFISNV